MKVESQLLGSKVTVLDPNHDGVHLKAKIVYNGFEGKSVVEQHRMVYDILQKNFDDGSLHALNLETLIKE